MHQGVSCMRGQNDDFQVDDVRVYDSQTRGFVAKFVLIVAALFLLGAATYGMYRDEFSGLSVVVMFVEAPIFTILGFYFGKH